MENDYLIETTKENIKIIRLNRPQEQNVIDNNTYIRITNILNDAATDEDIKIVVLTGTGEFYSFGHDIVGNRKYPADIILKSLQEFINAFITFPKILISIVNGPARGIAVTTLPLCDFVFASENAFFSTPFTKYSIVAEGCSTLTFPKLMGYRKAMNMLIMNHKMLAQEAFECGLISKLYKADELQKNAWDEIAEISNLPVDSVLTTKKLIRRNNIDELIKTNIREIQELKRIAFSNKI